MHRRGLHHRRRFGLPVLGLEVRQAHVHALHHHALLFAQYRQHLSMLPLVRPVDHRHLVAFDDVPRLNRLPQVRLEFFLGLRNLGIELSTALRLAIAAVPSRGRTNTPPLASSPAAAALLYFDGAVFEDANFE